MTQNRTTAAAHRRATKKNTKRGTSITEKGAPSEAENGTVLLRFMAQACACAQERIDCADAWPTGETERQDYMICVSYQMACFLAQNTVKGDVGVESDVVLDELVKHPAKGADEWTRILAKYAARLGGWKHKLTPWELPGIKTSTFRVRYKNRTPDPGICRVVACDWDRRSLTVSNGRCTYFPSFDEVEEVVEEGVEEVQASSPAPGQTWVKRDDPDDRVTVTSVEGNTVYYTKRDRRTHLYAGKGSFTDHYQLQGELVPKAGVIPTIGQIWVKRDDPGDWVTITSVDDVVRFTQADGTRLYTSEAHFVSLYQLQGELAPKAGELWIRDSDMCVVRISEVTNHYVYLLDGALPDHPVHAYFRQEMFVRMFHRMNPQPCGQH